MSTYLGSQFRAQMWMRRISSRGGAWMMLSALGAAAVGVWLLLVCGLAVTTLLGGAPRGTTSDVFQAVSEWLALPGAALMMTAGGIGTWLWGPALGGDQAATRRVALATGIIGGGAAWMVWVCVIVIEWAMPRRNFGPGGDPTIAMILSYARWVGGVSALCAGVGVVMSGIVWGMVERRCKWVLEERAKAQS